MPFPVAKFDDQTPLPKNKINVPNFWFTIIGNCLLLKTLMFMETLFGEPITHVSSISPLEHIHGSGTKCIPSDKKNSVSLT